MVHYLGQVQEEMLGGTDLWGLPAHLALRILQRPAVISEDPHGSNSQWKDFFFFFNTFRNSDSNRLPNKLINGRQPTCHKRPHPELHGVDEPPTFVTLVTTGLRVVAEGTRSFYKAVGQEALAVLTAQLLDRVLHQEAVLVEAPEDVLCYPAGIMEVGGPQDECTGPSD